MPRGGRGRLSSGNGGILGSGIFGLFGTTVHCNATDTSMYCQLSKTVNTIIMVLLLLYFLYLAYHGIKYFSSSKKSGGGGLTGGYVYSKTKSNKRGKK
jgi:hypothetical protein